MRMEYFINHLHQRVELTKSSLDPCLFYYYLSGTIVLIMIYVNNIIFAAKDQSTSMN